MCRTSLSEVNVKEHCADAMVEKAVRSLVGDEVYEERLAANNAELEEIHKVADTHLPIFFMYPGGRVGQDIGLHLFEPRYKILIRRCWEGNRCFVYCGERPRMGTRGVVVRVDSARFMPDGRANIVGVGVESIELGETWVEDGTGGLFYTKVSTAIARPPSLQMQAGESGDSFSGGASGGGELGMPLPPTAACLPACVCCNVM